MKVKVNLLEVKLIKNKKKKVCFINLSMGQFIFHFSSTDQGS